ncbi:MAG: 3-isopropylmalate dehydrogenase [Alphaproteobacteria bacterium]|nr:3-isopropylmalate dehydrogenase [Alphaproteobacteria bacterium]
MASNRKLLVLPGDGIGPEVMNEVRKIVAWMGRKRAVGFDISEDAVGGDALDRHGVPLTDAAMAKALEADAVLFGSVGGPKWDTLPFDKKPERGLLRLRKEMDLFANLRPAKVFDALVDASSLKPEIVKGLDILIIRELTGGVYFGEPRGVSTRPDGQREAIDTQRYSTSEIRRVCAVAFELARKRNNKVCSSEKANVMHTGVLWREEATKLHKESYTDVQLNHMYADALAMQLVRWPAQFDVIVTDNLFGDILSDEASMLTGSLGMLPSASLGAPDATGRRKALYEPIHGSAPDIAGKGIANPLAETLSYAMMLRYSFDLGGEADLVEKAVENVLAAGYRTADLLPMGSDAAKLTAQGLRKVGTQEMGDALVKELDRLV